MKKLALHELNRLSREAFKQIPKRGIILYADNIRSGHNIGSFFRIADAFAFESVCLGGYSVAPPHPEIQKTAIGSTESVDWIKVENASEYIQSKKDEGYQIIAIEQTNESIPLDKFEVQADKKYILIFGNEVHGVSDELLKMTDSILEIPQHGTKHSLNVSVAAGILAWVFR